MTATKTRPDARRIDKTLFEAGSQCSKRLYLEVHGDPPPHQNGEREVLEEVGHKVVEIARQAFPRGVVVDGKDRDAAVAQTEKALRDGGDVVLFDARFRAAATEVQTDVVIRTSDGQVDIVEVKAGTTVKPRHLLDVALQILTIEQAGFTVRSASILHLDARYRHGGGATTYPVHRLFRSVDVTARTRRLVPRITERVARLLAVVDDEESLDLPTGTWCHHPLPCPFFQRCVGEGPTNPLVFLPELTHPQETRLHERGIEDLAQIPEDEPGLTLVQRRALKSLRDNARVVEPFVTAELQDLDFPVHCLHVHWHMEVLPTFENQRPWQKLPAMWSVHVLQEDGSVEQETFVPTEAGDPSASTLASLAERVASAGTVITFQPELDGRLRALFAEESPLKQHVRALLNVPLLELATILQKGVYAPGLRGSFALPTVHAALLGQELFAGLELRTDDEIADAFRKLFSSRARAKTRTKLGDALRAHAERTSEGILAVLQALR